MLSWYGITSGVGKFFMASQGVCFIVGFFIGKNDRILRGIDIWSLVRFNVSPRWRWQVPFVIICLVLLYLIGVLCYRVAPSCGLRVCMSLYALVFFHFFLIGVGLLLIYILYSTTQFISSWNCTMLLKLCILGLLNLMLDIECIGASLGCFFFVIIIFFLLFSPLHLWSWICGSKR